MKAYHRHTKLAYFDITKNKVFAKAKQLEVEVDVTPYLIEFSQYILSHKNCINDSS